MISYNLDFVQVDAFVDIKRPFIKNLWGVQISYTFRSATISTIFATVICFVLCCLSLVLKGDQIFLKAGSMCELFVHVLKRV